MPRYRYNEDGSLTIIDDSPNSHQPNPGRSPRPTDNRSGQDHGDNGFPLFRARMHVLLIILGIVAAAFMLASCSESGGEFSHKMSEKAWTEFKASDAKHSVMEQGWASIEGRDPAGNPVLAGLEGHDWGYGFGLLGPGTKAIFENFERNVNEVGQMMEAGLDDLDI